MVVDHQNFLYIGLTVEYLSAKLDIGNDAIVAVVLQGSAAQLQLGAKLLVCQETFTAKHWSVVLDCALKIINHSVEVAHDVLIHSLCLVITSLLIVVSFFVIIHIFLPVLHLIYNSHHVLWLIIGLVANLRVSQGPVVS